MDYIVWLVVFVILAVFELITMGLTSIWFAIGALAACAASLLGGNWIVQSSVFIIVSIVILLFIRPFAVNYINNNAEKTNVESIVDKVGKVTQDINNVQSKGVVVIDGMEWSARSLDNTIIEENSLVKVKLVEGVKVIVEKIEED